MNGFELTRLIRKDHKEWIPIIFLTSKTQEKYLAEGIESGGDDYIHKPISEVVLISKLKAMARIFKIKLKLDEANEQLSILTQTDALTGLVNRRGMRLALKKLWKSSLNEKIEFSVIFMDIDYFKPFNDGYGHQQGDKALRDISNIITDNIRQGSDIAIRYGGEEFLVILPETNIQGALKVISVIKERLNNELLPHEYRTDDLNILTMSFGVSSSVLSNSISELLQQADTAMYKAKELGRNRAFNYEDLLLEK